MATIVTGAVAWWKNNSFTTVAQTADTVMKQMKVGQLDTGSLQPILNRVPVDAQADPPSKTGDAGSKADGIPAAEPAASGTADGEEKPAAAGAAAGEAEITVAGADSGTMEEAVSSLEANRPAVDVSPVLPAADHTAAEADERLSDAAGLTDESSAASSISDRSASDPF